MMKTNRVMSSSLRALKRNKLRTFFMMLGTLIGVTALTVVVALGQGAQQEVLDHFQRMFSGSQIRLQAIAESQHGVNTSTSTTLTIADLDAIQSTIPGVVMHDPMQYQGAGDFVFNGESRRTAVRGHSERYPITANRGVTRGAFFSERDVRASARVALVGETLVERVFGDVDPVGQTVRVGTIPFEVIGVLAPMGLDPHGIDRDNEIIIPISTMLRRVMNVDFLNFGTIIVDESVDLDATVAAVETLLRQRHSLAESEPNDFRMYTPDQVQQMIKASNRVFTVLLPLIALISIVVGAGVVANVMLMSVGERKSEIGLRKAIGARPRDIWWQFLLESTMVTTFGGMIAIGLGLLTLRILALRAGTDLAFPWGPTMLGMAIAVAVGVAAGVLPARRASSLDPVESLR